MMALTAIFIAFTLAGHPQISYGQLNVGNGFSAESNKIAASQQQSHNPKTETTSMINTENIGSTKDVKFLTGVDLNPPNVNRTTAFLKGNIISNLKFVRNQPHDVHVSSPAFKIVRDGAFVPQSPQGNFRSVFLNAKPIGDQLNATTPKIIEHAEMNAGSPSQSPLYITFGSPPHTSSPSQASFRTNVQPVLSSVQFVPNPMKLQTIATASPVQTQVPHQTFASPHIPPTNVQNQAKLFYAQMPLATPPPQPITPTPDNIVQSRHSLTSLLLSHLLSLGSNVEDTSTPITNHYTYRNSKPTNVKALLPLLLSLLNERNNGCCECGQYQRYNKCKPQKMQRRFEYNSVEVNPKPNTKQRWTQAWPFPQDSAEDDGYSDEMSDYSDEYYNDD